MGFIYKIEVEGELYIGSTIRKSLSQRQHDHNYKLKNNCNYKLYNFCRRKNIKKIKCELLQEINDTNIIKELEQEYINKLEPTLNSNRAIRTEEEHKEQIRFNIKIKSNCPICNKELLKNNIKRHIKSQH